MISPLPKWWRITPGAFTAQLACTTQPMTWRAGMARAISPVGSTACSAVPASAPPKPSKNHQGTPFMAVSTMVSGPISGAMWRATSSSAGALTAMTTRSCTPSAAGSLLARTGVGGGAVGLHQLQAVLLQRGQRGAARHHAHRAAHARQTGPEPAADGASAVNRDVFDHFLPHPSVEWSWFAINFYNCRRSGPPAAPARRTRRARRRARG
jgi:hypothetical protein